MADKSLRETKLEELRELLKKADKQELAEYLIDHGAEVRKHASWLRDDGYKGTSKEVYVCSLCGHWQSVKKVQPGQKMYMRYCPFCGARMDGAEGK